MNKLNPHGYLASFYRYFYLTDKLPNNLCNYCWSLLIAFLTFPFVWMAVLMNRMSNKIKFNTEKYNHYENGEFVDVRPRNRYEVGFNPIQTAYGLLFTFATVMLGAFVFIKLLGNQPAQHQGMGYFIKGLFVVYAVGVATIISCVLLYFVYLFIYKFFIKLKKKPTTEEIIARDLRAEEKRKKYWEKVHYREKNPNFIVLFWRYIVALKEKNCPIIEWDYNKKRK